MTAFPDPSGIMATANAFYHSQLLFTTSDLGLYDCVAELESPTVEAIADKAGLHVRGARLLLDGAVAIGLLIKDGEMYGLTESSRAFLVSSSPMCMAKAIRYNRDVYQAWGSLKELALTGKPVEAPDLHLGDDAQRTRTFVLSMHERALAIGQAVVPMLQLQGKRRMLDVGGGPGTYSVLLTKANAGLMATVIDLPGVAAIGEELVAMQEAAERVAYLPGSYHEVEFPDGQDVVLFFGMLHQESPDGIRSLFRKAHQALKPGGQVFVMDMMTDATHAAPAFSALFAINMALTTHNGWVFSDEELSGWLQECGFSKPQIRPLPKPMPHWLATAVKI